MRFAHVLLAACKFMLLVLFGAGASTTCLAQSCDGQWLPGWGIRGVDAGVRALLSWDPDGAGPQATGVVVGGFFGAAGSSLANGIAFFNPVSRQWSSLGLGLDLFSGPGTCYALAQLPNGELVAGGIFDSAGGVATQNIARWNGSSWLAFGTGLSSTIRALAVLQNGDLVATGGSTVSRWSGAFWSILGGAMNGSIQALAVMPNGDLIAGGLFTTAVGNPANRIARWNGSAWSPMGTGFDAPVHALLVMPNGDLIAGGEFSLAGGVSASRIARWNGVGWSAVGSGLNDAVFALRASGNNILAGGRFKMAGATTTSLVAMWNGTSWSQLGNGLAPDGTQGSDTVYSLTVLPSGQPFAGGVFSTEIGRPANHVARLNGATWETAGANGQTDHWILASTLMPDGSVIVGGDFTGVAGLIDANRIARFDGVRWSPLGGGFDGSVRAVAPLPNGQVVAGGDFTSAEGAPASRAAIWNGATWTSMGTGLDDVVHALAVLKDGDIVAGGRFGSAGGVPASRIARWNGSAWLPLGSGLDSSVLALTLLPSGDLIAGGFFVNTGGGMPVNHVARWDGVTWSPLGDGLAFGVRAMAVDSQGRLLASGDAPLTDPVVARWNGAVWEEIGSPISGMGYVTSIQLFQNDDIVVGGILSNAPFKGIARWNGASWSALNEGVVGFSHSLVVLPNDDLIAAGAFRTRGGAFAADFARWTSSGLPQVGYQPSPNEPSEGGLLVVTAAPIYGFAERPDTLSYQWLRNGIPMVNGASGASPGGGTVSGASGALAATETISLVINGAQLSDGGQYQIAFTNGCGTTSSASVPVAIDACFGDANRDRSVNFVDVTTVLTFFGTQYIGTGQGDSDRSGAVNFGDITSTLTNWGAICP